MLPGSTTKEGTIGTHRLSLPIEGDIYSRFGDGLIFLPPRVFKILEKDYENQRIVPKSAIIALGNYEILSQGWLSTKEPLDGFFEKGQSLNPSKDQIDDTKRQCWFDGKIYRYNPIGSHWILSQLGFNTPECNTIVDIYDIILGMNNKDKMKNIQAITTGRYSGSQEKVFDESRIYLLSCTRGSFGGLLALSLPGNETSETGFSSFGREGLGIVPFGIRNYKNAK